MLALAPYLHPETAQRKRWSSFNNTLKNADSFINETRCWNKFDFEHHFTRLNRCVTRHLSNAEDTHWFYALNSIDGWKIPLNVERTLRQRYRFHLLTTVGKLNFSHMTWPYSTIECGYRLIMICGWLIGASLKFIVHKHYTYCNFNNSKLHPQWN